MGEFARPGFPVISTPQRMEHFCAAGALVAIFIVTSRGRIPKPISPIFLLSALSKGVLGFLTLSELAELDDDITCRLQPWFEHPAGEPIQAGTELLELLNEILPGDGVNVSFLPQQQNQVDAI
jgi:hypothetical protein